MNESCPSRFPAEIAWNTVRAKIMRWIAPSEKGTVNATLEKRLWDTADQFRANSGLKAQEYSGPILGIIFLRFAEVRFAAQRAKLELPSPSGRGAGGEGTARVSRRGSRVDESAAYHAEGILYLAPKARFDHLLNLPEAADIGAKVNDAMRDIDARHIYRQVDRAHREWTPAQIGFLANLVRLYRGEAPDFTLGGDEAAAKLKEVFGKKLKYADVAGLCKAARLREIEGQGWSLNPGRYIGVAPGEAVSDEDFKEQLETLNEELETLNVQARELEATIASNVAEILAA